jgi:hypothetical protein
MNDAKTKGNYFSSEQQVILSNIHGDALADVLNGIKKAIKNMLLIKFVQ